MGREEKIGKPWSWEPSQGLTSQISSTQGNPGKPLWAPFVCSRPGSDDAVDLV